MQYLEDRGVIVDPATYPNTTSIKESLKEGILWGTAVRIMPHDRITNDDLAVLPNLNPIFRLSIYHPAITEEGFKILKELEGLRWVSLHNESTYGHNISGGDIIYPVSGETVDRIISYLADNRHLESISFAGPLSGETLERFSKHKDLRALALRDAVLTEEGMRQIGTLTKLKTLSLVGCDVTDTELSHLAGLKDLEWIALNENPITGSGLDALTKLPKLKQFYLTHCFLSDEGTTSLGRLDNLEFLELSDNQIGDRTLQHLATGNLKHLSTLRLLGTDVTDKGMKHLASLTSLEQLSLSRTRVTGEGLAHLSELPKLKSIGLGYAGLTDKNAEDLLQLKQVESFVLDGNDISDATVPILTQLKQLRFLSVCRTEITEEGLATVREALPKCRIGKECYSIGLLQRLLLKNEPFALPPRPGDSSFEMKKE